MNALWALVFCADGYSAYIGLFLADQHGDGRDEHGLPSGVFKGVGKVTTVQQIAFNKCHLKGALPTHSASYKTMVTRT